MQLTAIEQRLDRIDRPLTVLGRLIAAESVALFWAGIVSIWLFLRISAKVGALGVVVQLSASGAREHVSGPVAFSR